MKELFVRFFTLDGLIAANDALIYVAFAPEEEIINGFFEWCKDNKIEEPQKEVAILFWKEHMYDIVEAIKEIP